MAAAVHKLFHPHSHSHSKSEREDDSQNNHQPASPHERQDSAMDRAREEEKRALAQWEDQKRPLSPSQIESHRKTVGHSSQVLRQQDFELVKTLGTGMWCGFRHTRPRC
jgi:protein kinase A